MPWATKRATASAGSPDKIVIVGGGAAGFAAAEMLRRQEFSGSIVMLSHESAPPVDRPNLSKDYLAGSAPEDWLPLRPDSFYAEAGIDPQGGDPGSPVDPKLKKKAFTTTWVSAIVFAILWAIIRFKLITPEMIPFPHH